MVNFNLREKCKICNQSGKSIFFKNYEDQTLKFFFINYYGEKKYNNFKHILNKVDYELLKCDYCNFVWQKYTPDENFSIEL